MGNALGGAAAGAAGGAIAGAVGRGFSPGAGALGGAAAGLVFGLIDLAIQASREQARREQAERMSQDLPPLSGCAPNATFYRDDQDGLYKSVDEKGHLKVWLLDPGLGYKTWQ